MVSSMFRLLAIPCLMIASSCSRATPEELKAAIAANNGGAANMWYKVRVATRYRGRPVVLEQLVICYMRRVPGAAFGTISAVESRKMHPMSVGQVMHDGSFLAVRLPDLCGYNRRFRHGEFGPVKLPGWASRGPLPFFPLMVWSDHPVRASLTEAYVGDRYFDSEDARLARPEAQVEFLPPTFQPPNTLAILNQRNVIADNSSGYDPGLRADYALPMSDPTLRPDFTKDFIRQPSPPKRFAAFTGPRAQLDALGDAPPVFHHRWRDVRDCLDRFQAGGPNSRYFAADPESGHTLQYPENIPVVQLRNVRQRSCYEKLNDIVPFTWTGRSFVADTGKRGFLKFQRTSVAWRDAPYLIDDEVVPRQVALRDGDSGEWFELDSSASPVRDPDGGQ